MAVAPRYPARACVHLYIFICVYIQEHTSSPCFAAFWARLSIGKRPINLGGGLDSFLPPPPLQESSVRDASFPLSSLFPLPLFRSFLPRSLFLEWRVMESTRLHPLAVAHVCICVHAREYGREYLLREWVGGSTSWGLSRYREIGVRLNYRPYRPLSRYSARYSFSFFLFPSARREFRCRSHAGSSISTFD